MYKYLYLILGVIAFSIHCGSPKLPRQEEEILVKTERVIIMETIIERIWPGKVVSPYIIDLGFIHPGRVQDIKVNEGDRVKEGEILATLEKEDYEYKRKLASLEVANAQDLLMRSKQLRSSSNIAEREYQENLLKYEKARVLEQIAIREENSTVLRAPYEGIIVNSYSNKGAVAIASMKQFTFMRIDRMHVEIEVSANELKDLKEGMKCAISIPGTENTEGVIDFISPVTSDFNKTNTVKISFQKQPAKLSPGMYVNVNLKLNFSNQLHLGQSAVHVAHNKYVYVVKDSIAQVRAIKLLIHENVNGHFIVSEGLSENDEVVTAGSENLTDNQKVKILN